MHRLDRTDDDLVESARTELSDLLGITGPPVFSQLTRFTRQSPQYEVGHLQKVARIDARAAEIPGIFLTGSGFRAIGIPDCITDGRDTAARAGAYVAS